MSAMQCEPMHPDEEGWSEWIHPLPGYLMQCCDCDLIHEMEFAIVPHGGGRPALNEGEGKRRGVIVFRARRYPSDSGSHPKGEKPKALSAEGMAERPEGHRPNSITQKTT